MESSINRGAPPMTGHMYRPETALEDGARTKAVNAIITAQHRPNNVATAVMSIAHRPTLPRTPQPDNNRPGREGYLVPASARSGREHPELANPGRNVNICGHSSGKMSGRSTRPYVRRARVRAGQIGAAAG